MQPKSFRYSTAHLLLLGVLLCLSDILYGQEDSVRRLFDLKLGLGMSANSYLGDFTEANFLYNRFNPGFNLSLQGSRARLIRAQMNVGAGKFSEQADVTLIAAPVGVRPNQFVETSFFYGDIRLQVFLLRKWYINPYVGIGAGFMVFSPKDYNGKFLSDAFSSRPEGEVYNTTIPEIPAVVGVQWKLNRRLSLGAEYTYRVTPTDYLDNIGTLGTREGNDALESLQLSMYIGLGGESPKEKIELIHPLLVKPIPDSLLAATFIEGEISPPKGDGVSPQVNGLDQLVFSPEDIEVIPVVKQDSPAVVVTPPVPVSPKDSPVVVVTPPAKPIEKPRYTLHNLQKPHPIRFNVPIYTTPVSAYLKTAPDWSPIDLLSFSKEKEMMAIHTLSPAGRISINASPVKTTNGNPVSMNLWANIEALKFRKDEINIAKINTRAIAPLSKPAIKSPVVIFSPTDNKERWEKIEALFNVWDLLASDAYDDKDVFYYKSKPGDTYPYFYERFNRTIIYLFRNTEKNEKHL